MLEHIVNSPSRIEYRDPINVNSIIYGSMIQCGIDRFDISEAFDPDKEVREEQTSSFIKTRISYIPAGRKHSFEVRDLVSAVFENSLTGINLMDEPQYSDIMGLGEFIIDLMFAMEHKTSLMTLLPFPNMENIREMIPAELFFPIKNLMSSFEPSFPNLPFPKLSIQSRNLRRFEQILRSDLFSIYSSQHSNLEINSVNKKLAFKGIVNSGKNVLQRNLDALQLKNLTISVLPVTTKLIDIVFGKLPGILADYSASLLSDYIKNDRRIVVYQMNSVFDNLIFL